MFQGKAEVPPHVTIEEDPKLSDTCSKSANVAQTLTAIT